MGRIYIADLADYVAGKLRGFWLDPTGMDENEIWEEIEKFLEQAELDKKFPVPHEEWAVHDYENFPNLGEYPDLEDISKVAEAIDEFGEDPINAYIDVIGSMEYFDVDEFQDRYFGTYKNEEDYAYEYVSGMMDLEKMMGELHYYFDYKKYARDLFVNEVVGIETSKGLAVFARS